VVTFKIKNLALDWDKVFPWQGRGKEAPGRVWKGDAKFVR